MKRKINLARISRTAFLLTLMALACMAAQAQTTTFTYQGRFTDSTVPQPTNGTYDFEFALYDANVGGTQQGATQTVTDVNVSAGAFTVQLDFTAAPLAAGANRYLEIRVKKPTDPAFVALLPRQPLTSAPYSIQSLNATNAAQLGGVAASNYLQFNGNGSQLTNVNADAANLTGIVPITKGGTGSATQNFVDLTTVQTVAGGKTFSSAVNTTTQYNIGGNRVLSIAGTNNLFAGAGTGIVNTGFSNSFVGTNAGFSNTTGFQNSFVGRDAGFSNTTGNNNSFVGAYAGLYNTTGTGNSFVGPYAGKNNTTGNSNSFIGRFAGQDNTEGNENSFVGKHAGLSNTTGSFNSFIGSDAGQFNTTGSYNTVIGYSSAVSAANLTYATAIGAQSSVSTSNTIGLGRTNGSDKVRVYGLGAAGSTSLCRNSNFEISTCTAGNLAEENKPAVEQINALREQIRQQQIVIDALKKIVCAGNPTADICREK